MKVTDVIRRPIVTEKTSVARDAGNTIVFEVARQAGHQPTQTLNTYGHLFDEYDPDQRIDLEDEIRRARAA